jgi:Predicted soluble lytic transglycosylase fused to an ABC-type amino acid-binding protein
MQCRHIFSTLLLAICGLQASAQKHEDFTMAPQMRTIKTDTIVIPKSQRMDAAAVAAKTAAAKAALPQKPQYKSVPLANEKAYYGGMHDYVMDFVKKYMSTHGRTLSIVQGRSGAPFSMIDNVLQQHDIPKELKYLAVIESALNNNAISKVGAVGPWQFMASTARLMGLTVNGRRDERKDLYKSTTAAAKYLAYLYSQLNDWLLVVAAYNSGPTPVVRAINRTGSNNFWDIKKHLPRETQGHVLAFIATATIFENMSKFIGAGPLPSDFDITKNPNEAKAAAKKVAKSPFTPEELKNMAIIRLSEPLSMDLLCLELAMDKRQLEKWNPDYELFEMDVYSSEFYSFRIPKDKLDNFIEKKESLTKRSKQIFSQLNM